MLTLSQNVAPAQDDAVLAYDLTIEIVAAKGLCDPDALGSSGSDFNTCHCRCEVVGTSQSAFQTPNFHSTLAPVWCHSHKLQICRGDMLKFTVNASAPGESDSVMGMAELQFEQLVKSFDGELNLGKGVDAHLHVRVTATAATPESV